MSTLRYPPLVLACAALFSSSAACAAGQEFPPLIDFSLEQLSDIVVTSVSRQSTRLAATPASVYLISATDIRRSGATSLPEALRLAPNLQVARVNARDYAITARGFASTLVNKLLVLIDGRGVYSPVHSGVFWDAQDVMLEDIDRIEVISGPGATIWGANAVTGVINIITRSADQTQGALLGAATGGPDNMAVARYGAPLRGGGHYRIYAKYFQNDHTMAGNGRSSGTGWHKNQAGFRADWNALSLSGDVYVGALGQLGLRDTHTAGANLVARWSHALSATSDLRLQAYLDHAERDQANSLDSELDTVDLEAQHNLRLGRRHNVSWGGGYRYTLDRVRNGSAFAFLPARRNLHWGNLFAQDEMALGARVMLTAGVKFEHNSYTGLETLPSLRLAWSPHGERLWWASLSRSVRVPSRVDRDFFIPGMPQVIDGVPRYLLEGSEGFQSEVAKVAEIGYRSQPLQGLSYSATVFHSDYDKLRTVEVRRNASALLRNLGQGRARGIELWGRWQVARPWALTGGLVLQDISSSLKPGSLDPSGTAGLATSDPRRYWSLRSSHDVGGNASVDLNYRYVGRLARPPVSAYGELDLRLGWSPTPNVDLSVVGRNLLQRAHLEFVTGTSRQEHERSVQFNVLVRF